MKRVSSPTHEFDLLELALILWQKRWILVGATLASFAIGALFTLNQNVSYRGELSVYPLNGFELSGFHAWNNTVSSSDNKIGPRFSTRTTSNDSLSNAYVTSEDIFERFQSSYLRGSALNTALSQHSKAVKGFGGNDEQRRFLLNSLRSNFKLEKREDGKIGISFETKDIAESTKVLATTMALISDSVKSEMLRSFHSKLKATELSRQISLKKISIEIETYKRLYEARKTRSLTIMREQAAIARQLGIEYPINPLKDASTFRIETSKSDLFINTEKSELDPFESRFFLQGYRAIDMQIANLQQRVEGDYGPMIDEVDPLILEKARLQAYNFSEVLTPLLEEMPLNDADFKIVRADIAGIDFVPQQKKLLFIAIGTIAGLLLAMIYVLLTYAIESRKSDVNPA